ncbi:MAG: NYN domain-containing protein [Acidobacteria bacterium]|nr:NYN domain-containing protein [Acidobacteriota bacterium]
MAQHDRLNIAIFIDFDNIEIGVKNTLGQQFDVGLILDAIKERGEVVTKIAYADWTRAGEYSRSLTQHAIRLVQRNLTPGGDKNGADINLALDALEMAFTHPHINAYVIVGGDSDFLSLVEKLKQYDKKVFVVGGRQFTSVILQRNCHEFIAYENLHGVRKAALRGGRPVPAAAAASAPIAQAFPFVRRALKILADREVTPQTGLLKSTLLQLDSTFSERNYGASSFLDFVEKLAQAGLVQMKTSGRSVMVELNPSAAEESDGGGRSGAPEAEAAAPATPALPAAPAAQAAPIEPPRVVEIIGDQADGVRRVGGILAAATQARWPMSLRNVKQILRASDSSFDERRYGFAGIMDLLRACQREGLIRLERDRRGGLRVFQGGALQHTTAPARPAIEPAVSPYASESDETAAAAPVEMPAAIDADIVDLEPMPTIDPTAELLGRAKPKRPRTRAAAPAAPAAKPKRPARAATHRRTAKTRTAES